MSALGILTDRSRGRGPEWESNPDIRLDPESIAKVRAYQCVCARRAFADRARRRPLQSYLYLAEQDRSAWTWELDREC